MTYKCDKMPETGDKGQRYEVTYFDPDDNERHVMGWTDNDETARRMGNSIDQNPSWTFPHVEDRKADVFGPVVKLRLKLTAAQKEIERLITEVAELKRQRDNLLLENVKLLEHKLFGEKADPVSSKQVQDE